jgi:hypothetical protein
VVLIQRGEEQYFSNGCLDRKQEKEQIYRTSGTQRRSIANHSVLAAFLANRFGPDRFCNVVLERSSLYFQFKVFSQAKIVIAQHGAALSNIFFMRKHGGQAPHVIEVSPPWGRKFEHFKNLAQYVGVSHHSVLQESDHSEVSIQEISKIIDEKIFKSSDTTGTSFV